MWELERKASGSWVWVAELVTARVTGQGPMGQ